MSKKSTQSMGALHPVLFFMLVYGISLFLAFFVCRTVYYSINDNVAMRHTREAVTHTGMSYTVAMLKK